MAGLGIVEGEHVKPGGQLEVEMGKLLSWRGDWKCTHRDHAVLTHAGHTRPSGLASTAHTLGHLGGQRAKRKLQTEPEPMDVLTPLSPKDGRRDPASQHTQEMQS